MSFKKVINKQLFLKVCIYGGSGSGKTTLAEKIAVNLANKPGGQKKVYVIDTEGGIDFFAKTFNEYGIECFVQEDKLDSVAKINKSIHDAINDCPDVIIIDSITQIGEIYQKEYVTSKDSKQSFFAWGVAKNKFNENICAPLKEASSHIIVCGRETSSLAVEAKDGKTLVSPASSTSIKNGLDIDYELNILIQMSTGRDDNGNQVRVAKVLKDRSNKIDGEIFINPTFENIAPHLEGLSDINKVKEKVQSFIDKINDAKTQEELDIIANEISQESLPVQFKRTLRTAYVNAKDNINNNL